MKRFDLNSGWKFNIGDENPSLINLNGWLPAVVPGTVHTDLLENKIIGEPFLDDNEVKQTWISESDWIYKNVFSRPENFDAKLPVFLVFEGIDTAADVYLNNSLLGRTDNMFLPYRFEITSILRDHDNELELRFYSPLKYARAEESKYGKLPVALNSERVYIRKAQYSFGWDWGPSFPTIGIWRPVYLIQQNISFIKNISFSVKELNNDNAVVKVGITAGGRHSKNLKVKADLSHDGKKFSGEINLSGKSRNEIEIKVDNPRLWWPGGEGDQPLYLLEVFLSDQRNDLDYQAKKVGIRTINLVLVENEKPAFRLKVNGKPLFAKGANWIPADSFLPRVSSEKYRMLLRSAKEANMNIVRVWGGGFYENDIFYEICDELGLMVWQDFMFACASYPEHKEFTDNVKDEIRENVRRLQHHPSIILWCGNNENEWIWYQSMNTSYKRMPGYKIYHSLIPKILEEEDGDRPYWPTTPFGFDEDPNSFTSGNRHEWKIWSKWVDYMEVKNDKSLFVTEFGFQGPADITTFEKYLSGEKRYIQSKIFEFHNKQVEGPERIIRFAAGHLPLRTEWADYIYLAQLNQGLALKTCLEHWRFNYPLTNGSIIWQLNDCWPVTSWALIDSELQHKIAYYLVKNIFSPQAAAVIKNMDELTVQLLNQGLYDFPFRLKINIYEETGSRIHEEIIKDKSIAGSKQIVYSIPQKYFPIDRNPIVVISLYDQNEKMIFRNFYAEEKWKYMCLPYPEIHIEAGNNQLTLSSDKPVYFIDLFHPALHFSDRGFILVPGEDKVLKTDENMDGTDLNELRIFNLNNYLKDFK